MSKSPKAQKVFDLVKKKFGIDRDELTDDTNFVKALGAYSVDMIELVAEFATEFKTEIPEKDAQKLRTLGDAIAYLSQGARANG